MTHLYWQRLFQDVFPEVPWGHWLVISILSLALTGLMWAFTRHSTRGYLCLGITFLLGLFLLDTAVVIRLGDGMNPVAGFNLTEEYHQLIHGDAARWTEMLANVAVFVPFGFFLSEYLSTTKRVGARRQIGRAALTAFGLSLCIESLQLIFRLGVFEITDLVLNTLGGFVGASMATVGRLFRCREKNKSVN